MECKEGRKEKTYLTPVTSARSVGCGSRSKMRTSSRVILPPSASSQLSW